MNGMTMRLVSDASGTARHMPAPLAPAAKVAVRGRKPRPAPDPIKTNGESGAEQLRLLIERIERMDEEIKEAQDDRRDVIAEAKGSGYDTRTILAIIARRKKSRDDVAEQDAMLETYLHSLGLL